MLNIFSKTFHLISFYSFDQRAKKQSTLQWNFSAGTRNSKSSYPKHSFPQSSEDATTSVLVTGYQAQMGWGHSIRSPAGTLMTEFKIETHAKLQSCLCIELDYHNWRTKPIFYCWFEKTVITLNFCKLPKSSCSPRYGSRLSTCSTGVVQYHYWVTASVTRSDGLFFERLTVDQNL